VQRCALAAGSMPDCHRKHKSIPDLHLVVRMRRVSTRWSSPGTWLGNATPPVGRRTSTSRAAMPRSASPSPSA
jgi:hypothetical protein